MILGETTPNICENMCVAQKIVTFLLSVRFGKIPAVIYVKYFCEIYPLSLTWAHSGIRKPIYQIYNEIDFPKNIANSSERFRNKIRYAF